MAFFFWSERVYDLAKNVPRNPSYRIFMDISFSTDLFTWTPGCYSTHKAWFLKFTLLFFIQQLSNPLRKKPITFATALFFFWKTEPNFCCLPSSPQKNMNLVVKLGSLLVHYSPFLKYSSIYKKLTTSILHFCFQNELFQLNFEFLA